MDEQTLEFCNSVLEEIKAASEELGFGTETAPLEESGGVPTIMIGSYRNYLGELWTLSCNVVPMSADGVTELYTQLYLTLTGPVPPKKEEIAADFVRQCNEKFMLGNLLLYEHQLSVKHVCAWEPSLALDDVIFQRTLACFFRQADVYRKLFDEQLEMS